MSWSSAPTFPVSAGRWTSDPGPPPVAEGAWQPVIVRSVHGHELAVTTDEGLLRLGVLSGRELAVALDAGLVVVPGMAGSETAVADDWCVLTVHTSGSELAVTGDTGVLGAWHRTETAAATDYGIAKAGALTGREVAVADDLGRLGSASARGDELAVAEDSGVGWFAWQNSVLHSITSVGAFTVQIPPWPRWIDVIVLGGGGSGANGNQVNWEGFGGGAGVFAWTTLDRGEGRNLWTQITGTVGAGGTGQGNGQASTATISGVGTLTGAGGEGTDEKGAFIGAARDGRWVSTGNSGADNGTVTIEGYTYVGGTRSTGDTANVPGSGGRGGGGATWPLQPGSGKAGGRGQVWIRFRY